MAWRGSIELRKRRQAVLGELGGNPSAHGGDELARRHGAASRADRGLHVRDRERVLEPRIVARTQAEQHDVVVIVDEPRNGRAPLQVDHAHAGAAVVRPSVVPDRRELPVPDRHGRDDRIMPVERVDPAVDQLHIARSGATVIVACQARSDHRHTRQQPRRNEQRNSTSPIHDASSVKCFYRRIACHQRTPQPIARTSEMSLPTRHACSARQGTEAGHCPTPAALRFERSAIEQGPWLLRCGLLSACGALLALLDVPNFFGSPHIGATTRESW